MVPPPLPQGPQCGAADPESKEALIVFRVSYFAGLNLEVLRRNRVCSHDGHIKAVRRSITKPRI